MFTERNIMQYFICHLFPEKINKDFSWVKAKMLDIHMPRTWVLLKGPLQSAHTISKYIQRLYDKCRWLELKLNQQDHKIMSTCDMNHMMLYNVHHLYGECFMIVLR